MSTSRMANRIARLESRLGTRRQSAPAVDPFAEAERFQNLLLKYVMGELALEDIPVDVREYVQQAAKNLIETKRLADQYERGEIAFADLPVDLQFDFRQRELRKVPTRGGEGV